MRVCFFSGSRSEYGINNYLLRNLFLDKFINLYFVVSGLSKSKGYGMTLQDIKKDNFKVSKNVKINIKKTSANQVSKNFSIILKELSRFLSKNKINLLILIGDRYETLAAALAAYINKVPIVHIHGGEKTVDSLDDNFRHSISKFSKLHFVSHKVYKKRLIQLGENKNDIHIVGGLGAQIIKKFKFLKKKDLERILKLKFESEILVVNFYPESQSNISLKNLKSILSALNLFKNVSIIFTFPTHEIGKDIFVNEIKRFSKIRKNCHYFYNLGQKKYLSYAYIKKTLCTQKISRDTRIQTTDYSSPCIMLFPSYEEQAFCSRRPQGFTRARHKGQSQRTGRKWQKNRKTFYGTSWPLASYIDLRYATYHLHNFADLLPCVFTLNNPSVT